MLWSARIPWRRSLPNKAHAHQKIDRFALEVELLGSEENPRFDEEGPLVRRTPFVCEPRCSLFIKHGAQSGGVEGNEGGGGIHGVFRRSFDPRVAPVSPACACVCSCGVGQVFVPLLVTLATWRLKKERIC